MRRITLWLFSTVAAVVLLFSYRTSTNSPAGATAAGATTRQPTTPATAATPSPAAGGDDSGSSEGSSPSPGGSSSTTSGTSTGAKTYDGSVASTRWGDVQVSITVTDGKITDVSVPVYPSGNGRDQEINAYALPVLRQETLDAQGAGIDTVSGATVTSDGYIESLQAALDAGHLA
jgi:uncharacterized protein with FMN-binding domain